MSVESKLKLETMHGTTPNTVVYQTKYIERSRVTSIWIGDKEGEKKQVSYTT